MSAPVGFDEARPDGLLTVGAANALALAWTIVECCPHKDGEDGTCNHPANSTPECHALACPVTGP